MERVKRNLTIGQVAQRTGLSKATICLAEHGKRAAPARLILFLAQAGADELEQEQAAWREVHGLGRKSGPIFTFRAQLPQGLSVEEARQRCAAALAEFVTEGV